MVHLSLTIAGFISAVAGVWITFGVGWALLSGGVVLFLAGGLGSAREVR